MPPRRAQAATSPTPTERSIAPSDSASNPPAQRLASATPAKPRTYKRSAARSAATEVKHDYDDTKPDVGDGASPTKRAKTEKNGTGVGGAKARVAGDAKRVIAEEIISRGVAALDVASLAAKVSGA